MSISENIIEEWVKKGMIKRVLNLESINDEILPYIPDIVKKLDISNSCYKQVNQLPKNITHIKCIGLSIKSLPLYLSENLEYLDCRNCRNLEKLETGLLPKNLRYLDCRGCKRLERFNIPLTVKALTDFDYYDKRRKEKIERTTMDNYEVAKKRIQEWVEENKHKKQKTMLDLSRLQYDNFPEIPEDVIWINCCGNIQLKSLKGLPRGLKKLEYSGCPLKELEGLPEGLEYLQCDDSDIEILDNLPNSIKYISITGYNSKLKLIKSLPLELRKLILFRAHDLREIQGNFPPKLRILDLQLTSIEKMPKLSDSVRYVDLLLTYISELLYLPPNLKVLDITSCYNIKTLPLPLPKSLLYLYADSIKLNKEDIPLSIKKLDFENYERIYGSYDIKK